MGVKKKEYTRGWSICYRVVVVGAKLEDDERTRGE